MMAEQEKEGAPRHVAQIRRARTSLPKEESNNFDANSGQSQDPISLVPVTPATVHPTSIASLCPIDGSSNINIICCWSASVGNEILDETIYGQHHLRNLLVRPQYKSKGCPLALTAKHAAKASHNFIGGPLVSPILFLIIITVLDSIYLLTISMRPLLILVTKRTWIWKSPYETALSKRRLNSNLLLIISLVLTLLGQPALSGFWPEVKKSLSL